ncbi:alpha/beta hydrolase [Paraglaciecola hydrolytica]|uniref:BD-FAE-like domain-containing protein n=1 Tax=Paraglaciecola hydrolytica TaxID=1799789 RepID=A0A148KLK2_9ALTE|nr:alpha/beta hydrolase [Paraglaciecola hydrolytica]KXI27196.1 hypothetical protein AX660_01615 [Paraglaciecola hydrolytica]
MTFKQFIIATVLLFSLTFSARNYGAHLLQVDDSYTVAERFVRNQKNYPEISWPTMSFTQGQQWMNDVPYRQVEGRELHLDVFLPGDAAKKAQMERRTAILLVHGGGWRSGNKSHFYPMANKLAQLGYVVVLPEYRLSVEAQYPAGLNDINHAIIWAKQHAEELGFEPSRMVIGGGSSGGQMAALQGVTADTDVFKQGLTAQDTSVAAIIDLDGVLDFTSALGLANENAKGEESAAALWFGGSYEKIPQRWHEASAASHINAATPPMLVISSSHLRFTAGKEQVFEQLQQLGIPHQYHEFKQLFHTFWLFDPYLSQTVKLTDQFLKRHMPAPEVK